MDSGGELGIRMYLEGELSIRTYLSGSLVCTNVLERPGWSGVELASIDKVNLRQARLVPPRGLTGFRTVVKF